MKKHPLEAQLIKHDKNMQEWQFNILITKMVRTGNSPEPGEDKLIHLTYDNARLSINQETLNNALRKERIKEQKKIAKLIIRKT
jgi:hypothetical protein